MDNGSRRRLFILPPLKQSQDRLLLTNKTPIIIENNLKREKSFLELSVDKFAVLTNQPKKLEKFKLNTYPPGSAKYSSSNDFRQTPSNFKWDTKNMPQIRVTVPSKIPRNFSEKSAEKRMRLLFQQKLALERIHSEKRQRLLQSQAYMSHSTETIRGVNEHQHKKRGGSMVFEAESKKPDLWASPEFQDINLKSQIINHFYSLDNRHIRYFRKTRPNYFEFTANRNFQKMVDDSSDRLLDRSQPVEVV